MNHGACSWRVFLQGVNWDGARLPTRAVPPGATRLRQFWETFHRATTDAGEVEPTSSPQAYEQFNLEHFLGDCRWE